MGDDRGQVSQLVLEVLDGLLIFLADFSGHGQRLGGLPHRHLKVFNLLLVLHAQLLQVAAAEGHVAFEGLEDFGLNFKAIDKLNSCYICFSK